MTQFQKDLLFWCNYLILAVPMISFYFCNMLTMKKGSLLNRWWKLALALAVVTVSLFPFRSYLMLHLILINSIFLIIIIYTFSSPLKSKILCLISYIFLSLIAEVITWPSLMYLFHLPWILTYPGSWLEDFEHYTIIGSGIVNLYLLLFFILTVTIKKVISHRLKLKTLWIYIILPIYQVIFFFVYLYTYQKPDFTMIALGILILFLDMLVDFIMIFSIDNLVEKVAVEENLSALYAQRQLELDYYQMAQKHMEDMRSLKHDFSNHLRTLHAMLEQGNRKQDLSHFLDESREFLQINTFPRYCEHDIVNAVLTIKKGTASQSGIPMDISARIPKDIPVSGIDLCSLFCNLLDNAIEACQTIKDQPRSIQIKTNVSGGFLVIKLENTYEKPPLKEHGFFRTSKENPEDHGYGMKLIERITKKYHGQFTAEYSENTFTASAALDISNTECRK